MLDLPQHLGSSSGVVASHTKVANEHHLLDAMFLAAPDQTMKYAGLADKTNYLAHIRPQKQTSCRVSAARGRRDEGGSTPSAPAPGGKLMLP